MLKSQISKGFTLIELLIVIVIIGILAGVLIAVIDPTTQQNRARDANIRATMNKIALSTNGYISAYGRIPSEVEFQGGLNGFTDTNVSCAANGEANCNFTLTNSPMPSACAANSWTGLIGDTAACSFVYKGEDSGDCLTAASFDATGPPPTLTYRLCSHAFGSENVFMYRSSDSQMYLCNAAGDTCNVY